MDRVKEEATALSTFFGEELPSLHSSELAGLGEGKTDGSTRGLMVKEMEKLRATALDKSIAEFTDQSERSVLVRKNTDMISFAFLLSKPGPHSGIPSTHISEQLLALLAVPSVLCRRRVGEKVGKLKVDQLGDNILNATIPGNHFIRGHNTMKNTINSLFKYCGILSEVEPYEVFADLIQQQPLNRNQAFRAVQAIIPDIRAELPDNNGGTKTTYIEVKTVSGMAQWYHPVREGRVMERREHQPGRGTRAVTRRELAIVK